MVGLVGTCLLSGDNVIELHTDSALGLSNYFVVSIRYKHKQLPVPLATLMYKLA